MGKLKASLDAIKKAADDLVRAGYPESTARKIASGELPMDEASRMQRAREQGFDVDTPVYHGTSEDFAEFDPDRAIGSQFWSTTDKAAIERGEVGAQGRGVIKDLRQRIQNPAGWDEYDKYGIDELIGRGYDGLKLPESDGSATYVAFDPEQYRDAKAAFDPDQTNSPNLLAGGAAAAVGLGAASEDADAGVFTTGRKIISGVGVPPRGARRIQTGDFDPRYDKRVGQQDRVRNLTREVSIVDDPKIDEVPLSDFEGKPFVTSMSDRTMAGGLLTDINGVKIDPVPLQGGQGYMFRNPGQVWASDPGITKRMQDGAKAGGEDTSLLFPFRMSPTGGDYAEKTGRTMLAYNAAAMNKRQKRDLNRAVKKEFSDWPGIDGERAQEFLSGLNGPRRKRLLEVLDSRRDDGGLSLGEARVSVVDPEQLNAEDFRLLNVGEIDANAPRLPESGHITYQSGLPGEGIGRVRDAEKISPFDLDPAGNNGPIRAADPLNPTATEMYTLRQQPEARGVITPEILKRLQDRGVDVGNASPEMLASLSAGSAVAIAANEFRQRREGKRSQWDAMRADLMNAVSTADQALAPVVGPLMDAIDMPWRGILGATRSLGGLAAGEGFNQAMFQGANQARQPIEQTAYDLGGVATDATGSPLVGAAVNTGITLGGPI